MINLGCNIRAVYKIKLSHPRFVRFRTIDYHLVSILSDKQGGDLQGRPEGKEIEIHSIERPMRIGTQHQVSLIILFQAATPITVLKTGSGGLEIISGLNSLAPALPSN